MEGEEVFNFGTSYGDAFSFGKVTLAKIAGCGAGKVDSSAPAPPQNDKF
jgi:hypothetical protein